LRNVPIRTAPITAIRANPHLIQLDLASIVGIVDNEAVMGGIGAIGGIIGAAGGVIGAAGVKIGINGGAGLSTGAEIAVIKLACCPTN